MAYIILIILVVILIIYFILSKKKERAFVISAVIVGIYLLFVKLACGPNWLDVWMFKPISKEIKNYIIKKGVPNSLKEIHNFPYPLKGCKIERIKSAYDIKNEKCLFFKDNKAYYISSEYYYDTDEKKESYYVSIENPRSKTVGNFGFLYDSDKKVISEDIHFTTTGISTFCSSLKQ